MAKERTHYIDGEVAGIDSNALDITHNRFRDKIEDCVDQFGKSADRTQEHADSLGRFKTTVAALPLIGLAGYLASDNAMGFEKLP